MPQRGEDDEDLGPRELRNLRIREISLVDRPANKRTFLLYKSKGEGDSTMPLSEDQTAALAEDLEGLEQSINAAAAFVRRRADHRRYPLGLGKASTRLRGANPRPD